MATASPEKVTGNREFFLQWDLEVITTCGSHKWTIFERFVSCVCARGFVFVVLLAMRHSCNIICSSSRCV